jgi:hypothetical protein
MSLPAPARPHAEAFSWGDRDEGNGDKCPATLDLRYPITAVPRNLETKPAQRSQDKGNQVRALSPPASRSGSSGGTTSATFQYFDLATPFKACQVAFGPTNMGARSALQILSFLMIAFQVSCSYSTDPVGSPSEWSD